jgi:RimJ/RimL family protein N-acetyltransferase
MMARIDCKIRPMEDKDISEAFDWRNDLLVLQMGDSDEPVTKADFNAWAKFNNALKLIFEVNGKRAGIVSVSKDPETLTGEWAFHLAPMFRRKGLSEVMLRLALYYIRHQTDYIGIYARVRHNNPVSHKLHKRLHFQVEVIDNDFSKYYHHIG